MDIKKIIEEKAKNAKAELDALVDGKTLRQVKASRMVARLMGETEAYNDSLTAIEQSQKPMKVTQWTKGYITEPICPRCGKPTSISKFCRECGQPLDLGEGEKK